MNCINFVLHDRQETIAIQGGSPCPPLQLPPNLISCSSSPCSATFTFLSSPLHQAHSVLGGSTAANALPWGTFPWLSLCSKLSHPLLLQGLFKCLHSSYDYLKASWLIHIVLRQKPTQHCKAIIFQLKKDFLVKKIIKALCFFAYLLSFQLPTLHLPPACARTNLMVWCYFYAKTSNEFTGISRRGRHILFSRTHLIGTGQKSSFYSTWLWKISLIATIFLLSSQ